MVNEYDEYVFAINNHFEEFIDDWNYKFYFLVGGYGSSKSYHVATKIVKKLMEEKRTCLVARETYESLKDSCFNLLEEVCEKMGLIESGDVKFIQSPLQIKFSNKSKIIFKSMDKPGRLKSINDVSICWIEECSEVKYISFKEILGRTRHKFKSNHIICSTNPVGINNWTYKHFFKDEEAGYIKLDDEELYKNRVVKLKNTYYHHSTMDDNYFLPQDYRDELEEMRLYDEDLYRVARLGRFGISGERVLPQFKEMDRETIELLMKKNKVNRYYGLDFGFITSYNCLIEVGVDLKNKDLYILDCYYKRGITDDELIKDVDRFKGKEIIADSAEPKTIAYMNKNGYRVRKCKKFNGSVLANIKKIKRFKNIYCDDSLKDVVRELKYLTYKKNKKDEIIEDEFNIDSHCFDAIAYALNDVDVVDVKKIISKRSLGL